MVIRDWPYVAEEARASLSFPVGGIVGRDSGAGAQQAEKRTLRGIDYDAGMSGPDGQIAGLGMGNAAKFSDAGVEVGRGRVGVGEPGTLVESVDEVGAVGGEGLVMAGIERGADDGQAFIERERAGVFLFRLLLRGGRRRGIRRGAMRLAGASIRLLCQRGGEDTEAKHRKKQDALGTKPHSRM